MTAPLVAGILSGGAARRLGGERKGLLQQASGASLIESILREAEKAGLTNALLLANDPVVYAHIGCPIIPDLRKGLGPLAGIEAALTHVGSLRLADGVLFLPCDLPSITSNEIVRLRHAFAESESGIVVASVEHAEHAMHPLCCAIHVRRLPEIVSALDAKRLHVGRLWQELGAEAVPFEDDSPFRNINTPEDLASWRSAAQPTTSDPE